MIFIFLALMAIFVMELYIDDDKNSDVVAPKNESKMVSKEINVLSLSMKDENVTIICDSNYKILIHKNQDNYNYEVYKNSKKLGYVEFYGFHEILESIDKIKSKSYTSKVTFNFSEKDGDLKEVRFKLIPNDFEIKY
mgnify:CR=1 FL=1|jgi:hypothetical protein